MHSDRILPVELIELIIQHQDTHQQKLMATISTTLYDLSRRISKPTLCPNWEEFQISLDLFPDSHWKWVTVIHIEKSPPTTQQEAAMRKLLGKCINLKGLIISAESNDFNCWHTINTFLSQLSAPLEFIEYRKELIIGREGNEVPGLLYTEHITVEEEDTVSWDAMDFVQWDNPKRQFQSNFQDPPVVPQWETEYWIPKGPVINRIIRNIHYAQQFGKLRSITLPEWVVLFGSVETLPFLLNLHTTVGSTEDVLDGFDSGTVLPVIQAHHNLTKALLQHAHQSDEKQSATEFIQSCFDNFNKKYPPNAHVSIPKAPDTQDDQLIPAAVVERWKQESIQEERRMWNDILTDSIKRKNLRQELVSALRKRALK